MEAEQLNILNICNGGVPEIFERELGEVLNNINDPNTDKTAKRKIIFEFVFEPFEDRTGALVRFLCKSRLAPAEEMSGRIFLQRRGGNVQAYPHDPQQARLFNPPDGKEDDEKERTN